LGRSIEKLSALEVGRLAKRAGLHGDGGGLYLRVSTSPPCGQSWIFRYMLDGRAREMGIGSFPDVTLAAARKRAAEARVLKAHGKDPIDERRAGMATARLEAARAISFREAGENYIKAQEAGWKNATHGAQWAATLKRYVYPVFGSIPVDAVDVTLVTKVLEPIWKTKSETATRIRGRIEAILDWAKARGYRPGADGSSPSPTLSAV